MPVDDLWSKKDENGKKIPSQRHGRGKRWRVRYTDPDGQPRQKLFLKKADADAWDVNTRSDVDRGTYIDQAAARTTFREYAEQWRESQVHRDTTARAVESHLRKHAYPRIGDRPLRTIRPSDIQAMVRHWSDTLKPNSVAVVYAYVAAVLNAAVLDRLIARSPCSRKITRPRVEPKRVKPMLVESVNVLRDAMPRRVRALADLGAAAGLRQGEAFGLEVEHVDFLRRTIRVEQQLKILPRTKPFLAPPKTAKSRRTIPVGRVLIDRLAAHLAEFPAVEVEIEDRTDPARPRVRVAKLVSISAAGLPLTAAHFNEMLWQPAVKAAKLDGADVPTYHDLRHFFASVLIAHGASVTQVQHRLGHATATETLRTYSHLWPDEDDRTRDIVDAVLGGKPVPLRALS